MERIFHKRELKLSDQDEPFGPLPPSLPLVLSGKYDYDPQTHTLLTQKSDDSEHGELVDTTSTLHLVDISMKLLRTIEKPVSILSICGPYRTGKSYFLSSFLGSCTESFKLGHTMSTCTHGIWMSTSVLECEDFVVVLLDTEGLNSVGSSDANNYVTNLLMITVLLSSTLIYNSRNVPRASDVKRLSSFVQLSKRLMESEAEKQHSNQLSERLHLPHFVWLLRDVDRVPTNHKGEDILLTDYLVQLLESIQSSSSQSLGNKVSMALFDLFPTIQCKKLPPPSSDQKILADIVKNSSNLQPEFIQELQKVAGDILQGVQPKRGYNTTTLVDGFVLVSILEQYLVSLNKPGEFPIFDNTWRTAVHLKLTHFAEQLADEYEKEMKAFTCPRFPLEDGLNGETGDTLINAHLEIFAKKRLLLQIEIVKYLPRAPNKIEEETELISAFDKQIVQYQSEHGLNKVVGGKLLGIVQQNHQKSHEICSALYTSEYQVVDTMISTALNTSDAIDISNELKEFEARYWKLAIGPAKETVFEQRRIECSQKELEIKSIPGKPENVRIEGSFCDRIKIQWDAPLINNLAVKYYEVYVKPKGQKMLLAAKRSGCSAVVSNLKNSTLHMFSVRAVSNMCTGKFGPAICTVTDISKTAFALTAATVLVLSAGVHIVHVLTSLQNMYETMLNMQDDDEDSDHFETARETDRELQRLEQQLQETIDENYSEYSRECAVSNRVVDSSDDGNN